jgi:small-conductance mechanosensitive channel
MIRVGPPLILGAWLLTKTSPRLSRLGNPVVAYLVGVGAAAAISGALLGTLFPLVDQSTRELMGTNLWNVMVNGSIILIGTLTTLIYFHYGARPTASGVTKRETGIEVGAWVGQWFIAITLGAIFAGVYLAVLSVFIERARFIWDFLWTFDWKYFFSLF